MLGNKLIVIDKFFKQLFIYYGMNESAAHLLNLFILCAIIGIIAIAANYILKFIIVKIIKRWVDKSTNEYDDIFYEKGVFNKLSHLAPALIIAWLAPIPMPVAEYPKLATFIDLATDMYIIVIVLMVINSVINAFHDIYNLMPFAKNRSIKGYVQMVKSIVFFIGALMIISILVKKDLSSLFAGLTAFAAVLMFVFKDAILGLVAGIQISSNDILRVGDYIEMPNRNADGTIIDISLSIVKVQNTNRTITTIPTYAFVSESFWNWRGLENSEGRRIRRFVNIDMSTIRYCDDKLLNVLRKNELLKPYFEIKDKEYELAGNKILWEGKAYTNSQLFRAYIEAYLKNNPFINTNMNFMVRHLQSTEHGLPMEVYVYTFEKAGPKYEAIQADIFDHIIAIVPEFGLKVFQRPSSINV
jgi:miniconductance mechanosensitive channel